MEPKVIELSTPANKRWTFVLLAKSLVLLGVEPRGIIHIGAHLGEEVPIYRDCGFTKITLVEPDPEKADSLRQLHPDCDVLQFACAAEEGPTTFYKSAETKYSGLLVNPIQPPIDQFSVECFHARMFQRPEHNVAVVDTQGNELEVIKTLDLSTLDLIIVEATLEPNGYAAPLDETNVFMESIGWVPAIRWDYHDAIYCDMLYARWNNQ